MHPKGFNDIRAFGLRHPVAIVSNGIDVPERGRDDVVLSGDRVVLSLGRIHPIKGLDRLVRAWGRLEARYPAWKLRTVGPSELGHGAELKALAAALELKRVSIEEPVYGDQKQAAYQAADLFALATYNENFGVTVGEALAAGVPVIATKGAPWPGLQAERCGWWIDHGIEPLASAPECAMAMPIKDLRIMGVRGRAWMLRDFGWDAIAEKMKALYALGI